MILIVTKSENGRIPEKQYKLFVKLTYTTGRQSSSRLKDETNPFPQLAG